MIIQVSILLVYSLFVRIKNTRLYLRRGKRYAFRVMIPCGYRAGAREVLFVFGLPVHQQTMPTRETEKMNFSVYFVYAPGNSIRPGGDRDGARLKKTAFNESQLRALKAKFARKPNLDPREIKKLAEKIGLPNQVVKVWFKNARAKYRRLQKKRCRFALLFVYRDGKKGM